MTLLLIFALALVAASAVLMLRSFALASSERRRTLDQISAYGFHSEAVAEEPVDLRASFGDLAEATGEKALARFERLRAGERGLRQLLNSAGMYGTSVPAFVGRRILGAMLGPALLLLMSLAGRLDFRLLLGAALLTVMGWYLPYVRVQRRARLRLEQIDREVPELVDLLVTTVEGGVGFAAGLQLASRSIEGPLGQELRLALREQSLGLTPEETLSNLSLASTARRRARSRRRSCRANPSASRSERSSATWRSTCGSDVGRARKSARRRRRQRSSSHWSR